MKCFVISLTIEILVIVILLLTGYIVIDNRMDRLEQTDRNFAQWINSVSTPTKDEKVDQ